MIVNRFFSLFDKDRFLFGLKLTLIFVFVVLIFMVIGNVYSRYESGANMNANADIAFFVVETGTQENSISLTGLEPREEPFLYRINVQNFSEKDRCKVNMKYHISFQTTTNLPLDIKVLYEEMYSPTATNIITHDEIIDDDILFRFYDTNGYHNFTHTSNQTDHYTLVVDFPEEYKNRSEDYQGKIDLITVIVDAEQIV